MAGGSADRWLSRERGSAQSEGGPILWSDVLAIELHLATIP